MATNIVYWGCIGIMDKNMESTINPKSTVVGHQLGALCSLAMPAQHGNAKVQYL